MKDIPGFSSTNQEEEEITIFVKVNKAVPVKVKSSDTTSTLKSKLQEKESILLNHQALSFGGSHLQDNRILAEYGIQTKSVLHMDITGVTIFVNIPSTRKIITLSAKNLDTIQTIKSMIQHKEGIREDQQTLIYSGKHLEDSWTLASYNILIDSTLHLIIRRREEVQILIEMPSGETLALDVKLWYTVQDLKALIESMVEFPLYKQRLTYDESQLEDHRTLDDYNIKSDSKLKMLPLFVQIFVRKWSGEIVTLQVESSDTIGSIIERVGGVNSLKYTGPMDQENKNKSIPHQVLVLEGKRLEVGRTVADYGIQKDSTLRVTLFCNGYPRLRGGNPDTVNKVTVEEAQDQSDPEGEPGSEEESDAKSDPRNNEESEAESDNDEEESEAESYNDEEESEAESDRENDEEES